MSDTEENEQIARAIALSLESHLDHEQKEQDELKLAIAASLGKKVEQLTARDMLTADMSSAPRKRPREEESTTNQRVLKRFDNANARYWDGTVKLTYVKGFVGPDYIRFEDIIQKVRLIKISTSVYSQSCLE
jgi:tyrosyl-DNA phosphodiesterase-1